VRWKREVAVAVNCRAGVNSNLKNSLLLTMKITKYIQMIIIILLQPDLPPAHLGLENEWWLWEAASGW